MNATSLDSSAWIEIAHSGVNAAAFLKALADPASVIVSTITLYEVCAIISLSLCVTYAPVRRLHLRPRRHQ